MTEPEAPRGDAQALIDYVESTEAIKSVTVTDLLVAINRVTGEMETLDTQAWAPSPRRASGTIHVHTAAAFVEVVKGHTDAAPLDQEGDPFLRAWNLYADVERHALVAVLNDDRGPVVGWRDHRVGLVLRPTPEWQHWKASQGLKNQEAFAEIIEEGLPEVRTPSAASMLELAQTFQATSSSRFRQGGRLRDGRRQFLFEEDGTASAGESGELSLPDEFKLELRPFIGSAVVEVRARLKWRLRESKLSIGYQLVRPHEVEDEAFAHLVEVVAGGLDRKVIEGTPAPPVPG